MALKTKHLFPFIRLVNKLNIKNELKEFYFKRPDVTGMSDEDKKRLADERKIDFVFMFLEKAENVEKEFLSFLAIYSEKSVEEINKLEITETFAIVKDIVSDKNFEVFFQQAVKSPMSAPLM